MLLHAMRSHNTDWVVQENGCTALRQLGGFEAQEGGAAEGYLDIIGHGDHELLHGGVSGARRATIARRFSEC